MSKNNSIIRKAIENTERIIPRPSLSQEAADRLRDMILIEKLAPGTPVPERELSEALGISRTPLKEALRILEREGLIVYSTTRRPSVADPSLDELKKSIRVLGSLEALGGEIACEVANTVEIESIAEMEIEMRDSAAPELEFFQKDMEFHSAIVAASHNGPLIDTHRQYNARLWRARFLSSRQPDRRKNTNAEHSRISKALLDRNSDEISQAMKLHLHSTIVNITRIWPDRTNQEGKQK